MEKKKEQRSGHKSKRNEGKVASLKVFGSSSTNGDNASSLVGSIIEKGIVSNNDISKPIQPPRLSVLPFPVARHRSHGPVSHHKFYSSFFFFCNDFVLNLIFFIGLLFI